MARNIEEFLAQRAKRSQQAQETETPSDDPANIALERDYDAQFCLATHHEDIGLVSINRLKPYANHPLQDAQ
jgi:hypothetical protein